MKRFWLNQSSSRKISLQQWRIFHQRIIITDSPPSGVHSCLCPFFTGAKTSSSFCFVFLTWIAFTSCLPSQWMCHYTTRSDRHNQKHSAGVGEVQQTQERWRLECLYSLLKRGYNSHKWTAGEFGYWWDQIHSGDVWNAFRSHIISTYISKTQRPSSFVCFPSRECENISYWCTTL